jgi:hypothetical protein
MSFTARVFQLFIASPSDVTDEREIAVSVIQEWNDLRSAHDQLVILPMRWETHSSPEYGTRPQAEKPSGSQAKTDQDPTGDNRDASIP